MELDELKTIWTQHEKILVKHTIINREMLRKVLIANAQKRIDWIKVPTLLGLILPLVFIIFIAIPRIQFTFEWDVVIGIVLFVPLYTLSYIWAIKLYIQIEKLDPNGPITRVSRQVKLVEKYKLKITRKNYMLAPLVMIGIFLSAGIPFLSKMMIPFYVVMLLAFLIGVYIRSKHGLLARLRKLDQAIEEISKLESDAELIL